MPKFVKRFNGKTYVVEAQNRQNALCKLKLSDAFNPQITPKYPNDIVASFEDLTTHFKYIQEQLMNANKSGDGLLEPYHISYCMKHLDLLKNDFNKYVKQVDAFINQADKEMQRLIKEKKNNK